MSVESKMRNNAPFEDLDDELEYLANGKGGGGGPTNGHGHRNGLNGHRRRCESRRVAQHSLHESMQSTFTICVHILG